MIKYNVTDLTGYDTCIIGSTLLFSYQLSQTIKRTRISRLGMSVTTQGGSGRQCVTGPRRNISKYRYVLLNVYRFWET